MIILLCILSINVTCRFLLRKDIVRIKRIIDQMKGTVLNREVTNYSPYTGPPPPRPSTIKMKVRRKFNFVFLGSGSGVWITGRGIYIKYRKYFWINLSIYFLAYHAHCTGWDFKDDYTEFILSVFLYLCSCETVNLFLYLPILFIYCLLFAKSSNKQIYSGQKT